MGTLACPGGRGPWQVCPRGTRSHLGCLTTLAMSSARPGGRRLVALCLESSIVCLQSPLELELLVCELI